MSFTFYLCYSRLVRSESFDLGKTIYMSKLVIVESPTKAKTLGGILGSGYEVIASMGHIRDLPKKELGVDVEKDFTPKYIIPPKAKKTITALKKEVKKSKEVFLATDPDREGEAIAWHLSELLRDRADFKRVFFHELTKDAVLEAFDSPGKVNLDLVDAQQARRVLDRLVGYKLSPLLWKKVRYGLSAGRVQSVAVRLIVERERQRKEFKPQEYWTIGGDFENNEAKKILAALEKKDGKKLEIANELCAKGIETDLKDDSFEVSDVVRSERKRNPFPPFKTSTLQQAASTLFGFPAKRTMRAAQNLFEQGLITYHRTDSFNLSSQFVQAARAFIKDQMGASYLPEKAIYYKTRAKGAQEAHEAIRPTGVKTPVKELKTRGLKIDEQKIYSLIWKRSLECQMKPAVYTQTAIIIGSVKGYVFSAAGSIIKFEGWLAVGKFMGLEEENESLKELPKLKVGEELFLRKLNLDQHFTQPPARYTDASLIKKMEELGVGRPSTYAPTISTIQERGYVARDGRYFFPEDVAYVVNDLLVAHFPEIVDYDFTAKMEGDLDKIAEGEIKWVPVVKDFYEPFDKKLEQKEKILQKADITTLEETNEKCPECGKTLNVKLGKYGKFLSCSGFPACEFAKPINDINGENSHEDFGICDKCGEGKMVLKQGRFGKFLACGKYPSCKNTKPYLEKIGMKCPECSEGEIILKMAPGKGRFPKGGRGRIFYGCSNYPDCKYASWKNPLRETKGGSVDDIGND